MANILGILDQITGWCLSPPVLYALLIIGILFTGLTLFGQGRSLTHGVALIFGRYDVGKSGAGALSHFQALTAALSATVGLGNIAGVALAIEFGGPGAVFWMWMVGLAGMAIKGAEVLMAMLYRNTDDPENPSGGLMWVAERGLPKVYPKLAFLGKPIAILFSIGLVLAAFGVGNMFQAWSVGDTFHHYFNVPTWIMGVFLAALAAMVILGGVKRIGKLAEFIVPIMCGLYILAGLYVLFVHSDKLPDVLKMILQSAFNPHEATGAFVGGSFAMAFMWGMKRALFSSESGMGSAPIAHSAVKTREPVTEGIVAGLEPFIDTLVVCTITALVILSTGIWQRDSIGNYDTAPTFTQNSDKTWQVNMPELPMKHTANNQAHTPWQFGDKVFIVIDTGELNSNTKQYQRVYGVLKNNDQSQLFIEWDKVQIANQTPNSMPQLRDNQVYDNITGATLTAKAFDSVIPGFGKWVVSLTVLLFAFSTLVSWSYYGEQGVRYLVGEVGVLPYRLIYCVLIVVACLGFITTGEQLDSVGSFGVGVMLIINLPMVVLFAPQITHAYWDYVRRLKNGEITRH